MYDGLDAVAVDQQVCVGGCYSESVHYNIITL